MMPDRAQSESIGVILLTALVVVTVSTVGAIVLDDVQAKDRTFADVDGSVSRTSIAFSHRGGEAIAVEALRIVVRNDTRTWRPSFDPALVLDGDGDDRFEPGERWANASFDFALDETIQLYLFDTRTGTMLVDATLYPARSLPWVQTAPTADFSFSPTHPTEGEEVQFDEEATDPNHDVVRYEWDFDGDGTTDATGASVTHVYDDPGTYEATLIVTDDDGNEDQQTRTVVVNARPDASFDWSPSNPDPGETTTFDASTSADVDGNVTGYAWDFDGDGTTDATGEVVNHTFADSGRYDVTLTVTDDDGATDTVTHEVVVGDPPNASFTYSPSPAYATDNTTFDASASSDPDGTITSYAWDFDGDGTTDATGEVVNHTFTSAGSYTVTLTVEDDNNLTDTESKTVTVKQAKPYVVAVSVADTPIGQNDTGEAKNLTVRFDRSMDTGVAPTVTVENVSATVTYSNGTWLNETTYAVDVTIGDADEETIARVNVTDARDATGDLMEPYEANEFRIDTTVPAISAFDASNPSPDVVRVSFDASEPLTGVNVTLRNDSGALVATLHRGDFTESGSGPYTYTTNYTVPEHGNYTATLHRAFDGVNDGAAGENDTTTAGWSNESVVLVGYNSSMSKPQKGNLTFDIENVGYENATIVKVAISETSQKITKVQEDTTTTTAPGTVEVYLASTVSGYVEAASVELVGSGIPTTNETVPFTKNATLGARSAAEMTLYQFRKSGGGPGNLRGETVYVTVTYADGSTETFEIAVPSATGR